MIDTQRIQVRQEVVGLDGEHVGTVDHLDGNTIKLTRKDSDSEGQHHWIPLDLVAEVDDKVYLSVTTPEAKELWLVSGPTHEV
ncbi:DUF2171 domain-containing protein [Fimbriimonas ginsengisoli]|uniref:DUF2171 domain-containing protein n=1 Tax=Fimbriimonas ginsengisoli Gsoil 348 TaxID=661478 RepID=A0A068NM84_FIMGI|nr:DUF2171 domain-containing protein [Fimbriimonas ginsengisoli]AIE84678.1 hypothetical protein OP10G_1310 [Fimbriimonas ginsengisoli Gsoil 348]